MRRFLSAVTVIAVFGSDLAVWPPPAAAQEVSPETSQRLREAVERLRESEGDDGVGVPVQAPLSDAELDALVAPVALYPDSLLAQVLVAATYPLQIAQADQLITASDEMSDQELADALAAEEWDPSVLVLLSGFPTVITRMAEDLDATERLGAAMVGQDEDVLAAVQRMRADAEAAGNLSSNEAQTVTREADQISIRPAKRDVVYVPQYDPETVYISNRSAPYSQPAQTGFGGQNALVAGAVAFGAALLVQEIFGDDEEEDSGWDDYWRRDRVIDWRERQFYPRSDRDARRSAWSRERDRYWDSSDRRWRRDDDARRRYEAERRAALRWTALRDQRAGEPSLASWREKARLEKAREDRAAALRREQRAERVEQNKEAARREAARREKAADAREAERREELARERERKRADAERQEDRERKAQEAKDGGKVTAKPKPAAQPEKGKKPTPTKKAEPKPAGQADKKPEPAKKAEPKPAAKAEKKPEPVKKAEPKPAAKAEKKPEPAKKAAPPKPTKQADKAKAPEPAKKPAKAVKPQPAAAQKQPQPAKNADQAKPQPQPKPASGGKACPAGEKGKACRARN